MRNHYELFMREDITVGLIVLFHKKTLYYSLVQQIIESLNFNILKLLTYSHSMVAGGLEVTS